MTKGFAVLALVAVFLLGACGGDDSDETEADGDTTDATAEGDADDDSGTDETGGDGQTSPSETPVGEGYTDQIRSSFLNACAAQPGASQALCECTFDEITKAIPVEEFAAYDLAVRQDPATPAPSWLAEAVTACS
jgi:hypothetical protein